MKRAQNAGDGVSQRQHGNDLQPNVFFCDSSCIVP